MSYKDYPVVAIKSAICCGHHNCCLFGKRGPYAGSMGTLRVVSALDSRYSSVTYVPSKMFTCAYLLRDTYNITYDQLRQKKNTQLSQRVTIELRAQSVDELNY